MAGNDVAMTGLGASRAIVGGVLRAGPALSDDRRLSNDLKTP